MKADGEARSARVTRSELLRVARALALGAVLGALLVAAARGKPTGSNFDVPAGGDSRGAGSS